MDKTYNHLKISGTLHIIFGLASFVLASISIIRQHMFLMENWGDQDEVIPWLFLSDTLLALSIALIICAMFVYFGKALRNNKKWSTKIAGYLVGIVDLALFPFGTAIGVHLIWSLITLNGEEKEGG